MNQPTEQQREVLQQRDQEINPREVWGGAPSPEVITETSQQPQFVEKEPEGIPFTIYDGPDWNQKNLDNSGWKTEILEDPFL